jgi:hypothetical protein
LGTEHVGCILRTTLALPPAKKKNQRRIMCLGKKVLYYQCCPVN